MQTRRERLRLIRAELRALLECGAIDALATERPYESPNSPVLVAMHVYVARTLDEADALERDGPEQRAEDGWREWAAFIAAELEAIATWWDGRCSDSSTSDEAPKTEGGGC